MSKLMRLGVMALIAGMVCGVLERTFYGDVDENNVLQESLFLPLTFILVFLGVGLIFVATGRFWINRIRGPRQSTILPAPASSPGPAVPLRML